MAGRNALYVVAIRFPATFPRRVKRMNPTMRRFATVALVVGAAGCSRNLGPSAPAPAPTAATDSAAAAAPVIPDHNPCSDEGYRELRQRRPDMLDETEKRMLADMENACIDYRLAVARARGGEAIFTRPGGDYRTEVLPWLLGIGLFTGGIYLFTGGN